MLKIDGVTSKSTNAGIAISANTLPIILSSCHESLLQLLFVMFQDPNCSITSRIGSNPALLMEESFMQDLYNVKALKIAESYKHIKIDRDWISVMVLIYQSKSGVYTPYAAA